MQFGIHTFIGSVQLQTAGAENIHGHIGIDGAIYSYMSMNVFGPGSLELNAANEGMDTELHLTINGGDIVINSNNDGINTNEDGVSVTTVNGGEVNIVVNGATGEGDGGKYGDARQGATGVARHRRPR